MQTLARPSERMIQGPGPLALLERPSAEPARRCTSATCAHVAVGRSLVNGPNLITAVRTIGCVALALLAMRANSMAVLVAALVVYWIGDIADGWVARKTHTETVFGADFDIICDRVCAATFFGVLAFLRPEVTGVVLIFLFEFMVIDLVLSRSYRRWSLLSPNYFYVVDRTIFRFNWSPVAKSVSSGTVALLLLLGAPLALPVGLVALLTVVKLASLLRSLGLPMRMRGTCVLD